MHASSINYKAAQSICQNLKLINISRLHTILTVSVYPTRNNVPRNEFWRILFTIIGHHYLPRSRANSLAICWHALIHDDFSKWIIIKLVQVYYYYHTIDFIVENYFCFITFTNTKREGSAPITKISTTRDFLQFPKAPQSVYWTCDLGWNAS